MPKKGDIHLTLFIKAAEQFGYDARNVGKGTPLYDKVMAQKNKLYEQMFGGEEKKANPKPKPKPKKN